MELERRTDDIEDIDDKAGDKRHQRTEGGHCSDTDDDAGNEDDEDDADDDGEEEFIDVVHDIGRVLGCGKVGYG